MKKIFILIYLTFCSCSFGSKEYSRQLATNKSEQIMKYASDKVEEKLKNELLKNKQDKLLTIRYYPEHGELGDLVIGFLSNFIESEQVKIFKGDLNLMKNSNKKYVYFILAKSQYKIKSIIKKALKNTTEQYSNITFIYVGIESYNDEIRSYIKKAGMDYKFLDIDSF